MITCKSEGEAVSEEWDAFVAATPSATISHLFGWRRIIAESYGHKTFYLTARRGNAIAGILPLVHVKSRLFGNSLTSMPFQDYGGIVAQDEEAFRALLDHALKLKQDCQAETLDLRYREEPFPSEGRPYGDKATLILDISPGPENLWKSFSPKVRNQVRKAQKSGLSTQVGGAELLEEFYRPFAVNMRDLGSPVHHPKFFRSIFSVFGENTRTVLVRESAQTIGGLIALFYKDRVIIPWASCYRQHFSKCPNNLLYWDAMQFAYNRGCATLDFGRSSMDSGTFKFKLQWGAKPSQLHWKVFAKNLLKAPMESGSLQLAAMLWTRLPVTLANILGPSLRKHLTN